MSSPSRQFSIVDQALSMHVQFDKKRIEGFTSVRMCLEHDCLTNTLLRTHLCAKQMNIENVEISELDMYNKETKIKERIDEKFYTKHWFYPDTTRQLQVIKMNLEKAPPSVFAMREMAKKVYQEETLGFIKCTMELNTKTVTKISQLYMDGYKAYVTIKVKFSIDEPIVAGSFVKSSEGNTFFIKNNKISYARSLFPCLDYIDDFYRISKVKIATDMVGADIFCIGKPTKTETIGSTTICEFENDKLINANYLSIMVGKFEKVKLNLGLGKFITLHCQSKNLSYRVQNTDVDHIHFFEKLEEFQEDILRLEDQQLDSYQWIYLDSSHNYNISDTVHNQFVYRGDCLFFYQTVVLDCGIVVDKKSVDTFLFNQSEIVMRFMYSLHLEHIHLKSLKDYWIFTGISQFIADVFLMIYGNELYVQYVFESKKRAFYDFVKQGKDINPLTAPNFMHPSEASFDLCYNLKCCLIFHMMFAYLKLTKPTVGDFANLFLSRDDSDEGPTPLVSYMDTKKAYKRIKLTFGIKYLKANLQQFLQATGCSELDCAYTYDRKGNRMKLIIRQTPLHLQYYKSVTEERFSLEKFFNLASPINKTLENFRSSLTELGKKSEGMVSAESVNAFLDDDGRIVVNSFHNSLKYLSGTFYVVVTETNDIEMNEEVHEVRIEEKQDQEVRFDMRNKVRRVVQKKGAEIELIGGMPIDTEQYAFGILGSNSKYGGFGGDKNDSLLIGGAPYLWLKFDPCNHHLRKVVIREGENIYLAQLEKELKEQVDISNIFRILESLVRCATVATISKLSSYINTKEVDQLIKIEMVNTLVNLDTTLAPNKVLDSMMNLIKKLKFESDYSLKPNDFSSDYNILNHLINQITVYERKIKKTDLKQTEGNKHIPQTDETIIDLLLTLLKKNDNSENNFDDTFYQANILKSLFRCLNVANFNQILVEVNRFLKIEYFTHYDYKYLIDAIFSDFVGCIANHYDHLGISLSSPNHMFYDNPNLRRFPLLIECLQPFRELSERHQYDSILCQSIFRLNFTIRKRIDKFKPWEILIWSLKYVDEARKKTNCFKTVKILESLFRMMELYRQEFRDMQRKLNMQNNKLICQLLFDMVISPYSYIDVQYRFYALSIYKLIYDEFIPICSLHQYEDFIFPLDMGWMNFKFELNFEKSISNEKKIITLNHLSMQNRRKTISGQIAPSQGSSQYNLRELIFQNFKFTKESPTWRNLGKQIINVLLSEKTTMQIESEITEADKTDQKEEDENKLVVRIKESPVSLKELKRKLMKPSQCIHSMEEFRNELYKVIDMYSSKDYIVKDFYDEYMMLANALIQEAEKILREKAQKEEEKLRKLKQRIRATGGIV